MRPRSQRLNADGGRAQASYRLVTTAANSAVLVKSAYARHSSADTSYITCYARSAIGGHLVVVFDFQASQTGLLFWEGWIVLRDGDELVADVGGVNIAWWISGSLLEGSYDGSTRPLSATTLPA